MFNIIKELRSVKGSNIATFLNYYTLILILLLTLFGVYLIITYREKIIEFALKIVETVINAFQSLFGFIFKD